MKVEPGLNETADKHQLHEPVFGISLRFSDKEMERVFAEMLTENSNISGIGLKERINSFAWTLGLTLAVQVVGHITNLILEDRIQMILLIQIGLAALVGVSVVVVFCLVYLDVLQCYKSACLIALYCLTATCLIVFNYNFVAVLMDLSEANYYQGEFFLLLLLLVSTKFVLFFNYLQYVLVNSGVIVAYAIVLAVTSGAQVAARQFFLAAVFLIYQARWFYATEKQARVNFLVHTKSAQRRHCAAADNLPMTTIEQTVINILDSLEIVSKLKKKATKKQDLEFVFETLHSTMEFISSHKEDVDIEFLTRNMDDEDRIYIRESYSSQNEHGLSKVRSKTRIIEEIEDTEAPYVGRVGQQWNLNYFEIDRLTNRQPLMQTGLFLLQKYGLLQSFQIPKTVAVQFLSLLERHYLPKPYHNAVHASDVGASLIYLLHASSLAENMTEIEVLGCIVAGLGHDVSHPGLTGRYIVNSRDPLAVQYNDVSVLEMMHCSVIYKLLCRSDSNILAAFDNEDWFSLRKIIIEMVLATDLAKHFELLGQFKAKLLKQPDRPLNSIEARLEVLKMGIKAADVGHAAKEWSLHEKWSNLALEEFFRQGDIEKERGMKISMYCDRENTDIPKSQIGFIRNIVLPLYEALNSYLLSSTIQITCIDQLHQNMAVWEFSTMNKSKTQARMPSCKNNQRITHTVKAVVPEKINWISDN